jgi:malate dehydrogenase (oxaloacetate-decarboxylating)
MPLQVKVAEGLAGLITKPGEQSIVPGVFDEGVVQAVSQAVMEYANN